MNRFSLMLKNSYFVFRRTHRVFHFFLCSFLFVFISSRFHLFSFLFLFDFTFFCFRFFRCFFTVCVVTTNATDLRERFTIRHFCLTLLPASWNLAQSAFIKAFLRPTVLPWRLQGLLFRFKTQTWSICWFEPGNFRQFYDKYGTLFEFFKICW